MAESWSSGERYEPYVGRWSRVVARWFLTWVDVPGELAWVDVGCGTGALTAAILDVAAPRRALGIDPSADYLEYARANIGDSRVEFRLGDATELPVKDGEFDAAVSGLVLNFVEAPAEAVAEKRRAVRDGGTVAAYVWDYSGEMQFMRRFWDAAVELDPAAIELDQGGRFPLCAPAPLAALFEGRGLRDVSMTAIDIETRFRDFDDFWTPFLSGQGAAPGYLAGLPAGRQAALRERLRETLPYADDGSIPLMARAWAVRGRR